MYADDLVIFRPYSAGLQQLLRICRLYGADFYIKYNAQKSKIMIIRSREDRQSNFPDFYLSGTALAVCREPHIWAILLQYYCLLIWISIAAPEAVCSSERAMS